MQPSYRPRSHEPHAEHFAPGRGFAQSARSVPPIQTQHDEDRIAPEQKESLGIFLFCRLRRAYRGAGALESRRADPEGLQFPEGARFLSKRRIGARMSKPLSRAREVFDIEIAALKKVRQHLDGNFERAVEILVETLRQRGKIVVMGVGKSGNIGQKIAATLTSTGSTSVLLNSVDALHGDLGVVNDEDAILVLSYSGETEELLLLLPALKRFSVKIIGLTGVLKSTVARFCDVVLNVHVPREACPFNLAPTASTTSMLVMGDALAMATLDARGFKKQDFAKHHPGGAIGRSLLLRVSDIMRSGKMNPVAPQSLTVKEALFVMTKARSGSLSIVDARGRLTGVFTDGDLRRAMADDQEILGRKLKAVMTKSPIRIRDDALAVEALKIFNERNIDDLIVVNSRQEPVGMVDSQDLPKFKLM
jgi:arabinose-5-phosphate isomerase